ncbi:hypothetical protein [Photobacterium damselae]|uniref:hypothetical protein n=1 Tax=Photobacterium damselae TaxID=38293 RepID=UPI001F370923|nr:hypothetical protein [Photobacterium damselae]UKA12831.1 hypothetical protein IHC91_21295 [Photobacterium damselae subsp. damselae]
MSKINFDRYLVLKNQDIKNYLSTQERKLFLSLVEKVNKGRSSDDKTTKKYAVVSSNSECFTEVCKEIEQEIESRHQYEQYSAGFMDVMLNKYKVPEEFAKAELKSWLDTIDATGEEFCWESGRSAANESASYWGD